VRSTAVGASHADDRPRVFRLSYGTSSADRAGHASVVVGPICSLGIRTVSPRRIWRLKNALSVEVVTIILLSRACSSLPRLTTGLKSFQFGRAVPGIWAFAGMAGVAVTPKPGVRDHRRLPSSRTAVVRRRRYHVVNVIR